MPRPLPEGLKGTCEPPGGTVAVSVGPLRSDDRLRVDVIDVDGTDRNAIAEGTMIGFVVDASNPDADGPTQAMLGDRHVRVARDVVDPWQWLSGRGLRALEDAPVRFGREMVLASAPTAAGYLLQVTCDGNTAAALVPVERSRLVEAQIKIDCTGGWGLPIVSDDVYFPDRHLITR